MKINFLIFVLNIKSFADQQKKIIRLSEIVEKKEFSLIIIDGFNFYYRTLVNSKPELAKSMLNSQLKILKKISKKTTIIITNDVFERFDNGDIKMIGDNLISWWSDSIIKLEAGGNISNKVKMIKPKKKERFAFNIIERGIEKT